MSRVLMSPAASSLFRALLARSGEGRDRILLTDCRSIDWQSLTFVGERHRLFLRFTGPDAESLFEFVCSGLGEAEFSMPGRIVADIAIEGRPEHLSDGSIAVAIEALTIEE